MGQVYAVRSVVDESLAILRKAADEWALGNPEQPPTSVVSLK
jgi:hypothetical protein